MDALNSVSNRHLSPIESMQRLEQAILHADQRSRIRRDMTSRGQLTLSLLVMSPIAIYFIYNLFAPNGVMQNHKASSGNYMYWAQNFLYTFKPQTQIWRPEFYHRETQTSLHMYSKKIQKLQKEDASAVAGVHYPTKWH